MPEIVLGGLAAFNCRITCVFPQLTYNAAVGVQDKRARPQDLVLLLRGLFSPGRQTELRQSPEPRKNSSLPSQREPASIPAPHPAPRHREKVRLIATESSIANSIVITVFDEMGDAALAIHF